MHTYQFAYAHIKCIDTFQFHPEALNVSVEEIEKKKKLRSDLAACHYKLGITISSICK